jgi:hypothetical protein
MKTSELIKEIQRLPISQRIYVVEKAIHSIRQQDEANQMKDAADALLSDYVSDNNLTELTNLDFDEFYEAR